MRSFSDLRNFCEYIVNKYGSPQNASEEDKAEEFRHVYLGNLPLNLKTLRAIASACGISLNSIDGKKMPHNVRGFHDVFDENRKIYYKEGDTVSGIENTILHEFREMVEPVFAEACPDYVPLKTSAVHLAANRFAAAVLLPRDEFEKQIYTTGFDIIALSKRYYKSCSQVLLRMGEVLQGKLFFYAALYEQSDHTEPSWRINYWTGSYNEDCPESNIYGADRLFPRKGHGVIAGSLVDKAIKTGKTYLVENITFSDDIDDSSLIGIAQPLAMPRAKPSKVALIMMLRGDGQMLEPQVKRTKPVVVERLDIITMGKGDQV